MFNLKLGALKKRRIQDSLEAVLNNSNAPFHTGIGTDRVSPFGRLIGIIYLDQPPEDLSQEAKGKFPKTVDINGWWRTYSVPVQFRNIGNFPTL
jgi:hypothetical protein